MQTGSDNLSNVTQLEDIPLDELLRAFIADAQNDLHVALPARVESYNASKQTVTVTPMVNRYVPDGDGGFVSEKLPQLQDVPVAIMRGGGFFCAFPLQPGDTGQLIFSERSIGAWRATGAQADPGDVGMHTLDGAIFYPCIAPDNKALANADGTNFVLGSDASANARIVIKPSGEIDAGATAANFVAMADKVLAQLTAIQTALITHVHSGVIPGVGTTGGSNSAYAASSVASSNLKAVD